MDSKGRVGTDTKKHYKTYIRTCQKMATGRYGGKMSILATSPKKINNWWANLIAPAQTKQERATPTSVMMNEARARNAGTRVPVC